MSTRATYEINGRTFYIHHDGYPQGAASYFADALLYANAGDGLAGMFYRANDRAEFTGSHSTHGDTEYRYTFDCRVTGALYGECKPISEGTFTVQKRYTGEWAETGQSHTWRVLYSGSLAQFLNANDVLDTTATKRFWVEAFGTVLPFEIVIERARAALALFEHHKSKGWTGNACGMLNDLARQLRGIDPVTVLGDDWTAATEWYFDKYPHMREHLAKANEKRERETASA